MFSRGWQERAGSSESGLLAVTQQPKLLDDELLSQFNTFFVLGLADEKDRNILRSSAKQDLSALGPEIQTLMPGECLLVNLEAPFRSAGAHVLVRRGRSFGAAPAHPPSGGRPERVGARGLTGWATGRPPWSTLLWPRRAVRRTGLSGHRAWGYGACWGWGLRAVGPAGYAGHLLDLNEWYR